MKFDLVVSVMIWLFIDGKIDKIAPDISVPQGSAIIIDGKGKHVTPGLVDCHSHSAASSINEGAQAVTAEVRIKDVLYADDINIYRQLGGGLTTANILHGSANPIVPIHLFQHKGLVQQKYFLIHFLLYCCYNHLQLLKKSLYQSKQTLDEFL